MAQAHEYAEHVQQDGALAREVVAGRLHRRRYNCREFINYAHGINRTTGGDSTAYQIHDPSAC
jgi:hypothetical protein